MAEKLGERTAFILFTDIYAELTSEFVSALSDRYSDTDGDLKYAYLD